MLIFFLASCLASHSILEYKPSPPEAIKKLAETFHVVGILYPEYITYIYNHSEPKSLKYYF